MNGSPRVAIVTGGMGGLGTAIYKKLCEDGFTVVAICLPGDPHKEEWKQKMWAQEGSPALVKDADVTDFAQCMQAVQSIERHVGQVTVLVNNAGIMRDARYYKMTPADWSAVIKTDLDSVFNMTQQVLPGMVQRGFGRIVNISSVNGVKGQDGQANYAAAKAGILGYTKSIALEVAAKGVTVNAIAPGYVATDMVMAIKQEIREKIVAGIPVGRLGKPEEIAHAVSFLVSPLAAFMTGATLNINGGMHMC